MATKFKIDKLKGFFKTMAEIKNRIEEIAPLCTNITSREEVTGFWLDEDPKEPEVGIGVWSQDCGNDQYWFPFEYLAMDDEEILKSEKKKSEKAKREIERELRREKKAKERAERREYERLKKKYEGS